MCQMLVEIFGFGGSQKVPSIDHGPTMGVMSPALRTSDRNAGRSPAGDQNSDRSITWAFAEATLLATVPTVWSPWVKLYCADDLPTELREPLSERLAVVNRVGDRLVADHDRPSSSPC